MELYVGMVLFALVFLASLISVELGLSAAIIEITLGIIGGNFLGLQQLDWVKDIAAFGGILLTFMAGAEVDLKVLRRKFRESFLIGSLSFLAPFIGAMLLCRYGLGWNWGACELTGIALSTTSLAVVYAVLVESGLANTKLVRSSWLAPLSPILAPRLGCRCSSSSRIRIRSGLRSFPWP